MSFTLWFLKQQLWLIQPSFFVLPSFDQAPVSTLPREFQVEVKNPLGYGSNFGLRLLMNLSFEYPGSAGTGPRQVAPE